MKGKNFIKTVEQYFDVLDELRQLMVEISALLLIDDCDIDELFLNLTEQGFL